MATSKEMMAFITQNQASPLRSGAPSVMRASVATLGQEVASKAPTAGTAVGNRLGAIPGMGNISATKGQLGWILPILLTMYAQGKLREHGERQGVAAQTEHLKEMGDQINPEDMLYQAMMPMIQQENQMVSQMLMQQLMGDQGPQLARGEERIGGQRQGPQGY